MNRNTLLGFTQNVLAPGWVLVFGLILLAAAPLGVAASLMLLPIGVVAVPALMAIPLGRGRLAPGRRGPRHRGNTARVLTPPS